MTIEVFDELYPGRFLKASLFKGKPVTYTITRFDREEIEGEKGKQMKTTLYFAETEMAHVLPKINAVCLRAMFGDRVSEWVGKRVTFYGTTAIMPLPAKKNEPCIRVMGSPDIDKQIRCEWKPPRRSVVVQLLEPTKSQLFQTIEAAIKAATESKPTRAMHARILDLGNKNELSSRDTEILAALAVARINEIEQTTATPEPANDAKDPVADGSDSVDGPAADGNLAADPAVCADGDSSDDSVQPASGTAPENTEQQDGKTKEGVPPGTENNGPVALTEEEKATIIATVKSQPTAVQRTIYRAMLERFGLASATHRTLASIISTTAHEQAIVELLPRA